MNVFQDVDELKKEMNLVEKRDLRYPAKVRLSPKPDPYAGQDEINEMVSQYRNDFKTGRRKTKKQVMKKIMSQIRNNFSKELVSHLGHARLNLERGVTTFDLRGGIIRVEPPKNSHKLILPCESTVIEDQKQ